MLRLAAFATHPIQYQVPLWRCLAGSDKLAVKVFYASRHGVEQSVDPGFARTFAWDLPMLDGYEHEFLSSTRVLGLPGPTAHWFPKGVVRKLQEGRFDAVLVHGYATGASLAGLLAAKRHGLRILMRGESHEHGRNPSLRSSTKQLALPVLLRSIHGFLAIGTWNREYWEKYGPPTARIDTALYAVDNERFRQRATGDPRAVRQLRAKWGAGGATTVYLFSGKLAPVKAPDLLLRAYSAISQPTARLVIVGAGPMEGSLKNLQEVLRLQGVYFEGFVNQTDLPLYYRAADALVLPSTFEPWGLVVNEAMACGTPCIVSDVVGAGADLIAGQDAGLVFRSGSVSALTQALRAALDSEMRLWWKQNIPTSLSTATLGNTVAALESLVLGVCQGDRSHPVAGNPGDVVRNA